MCCDVRAPCSVSGIFIIPCWARYWIAFTKSESVILPLYHDPASFLIQSGMFSEEVCWVCKLGTWLVFSAGSERICKDELVKAGIISSALLYTLLEEALYWSHTRTTTSDRGIGF